MEFTDKTVGVVGRMAPGDIDESDHVINAQPLQPIFVDGVNMIGDCKGVYYIPLNGQQQVVSLAPSEADLFAAMLRDTSKMMTNARAEQPALEKPDPVAEVLDIIGRKPLALRRSLTR